MNVLNSGEQKSSAHTTAAPRDDGREFALAVARIADDNKTADVRVLDLRGLSNIADYFVIGTGTSDRQMRAVLDAIDEHAKSVERHSFTVADRAGTTWMLADYVDVVIHLFDEEHRDYYDLDGLWGDAPLVEWRQADEIPNAADDRDLA
ncbi:MAG: ribosome silencing factor [Phycisphaerae bacterium]|nr:ribosome silencing factor [Phycisphaerae bacterium]